MKLIINAYDIISEALETAIGSGITRFYKHKDSVGLSELELIAMKYTILNYCMTDLSEIIDWETDNEELTVKEVE